jgi:hypothetical protein
MEGIRRAITREGEKGDRGKRKRAERGEGEQ